MAQTLSVVVPVYDGVTQLDFTGPHQFLSRTPDVQVRVASLDGRPVTADRLTFSNLEDLGAITACDVLLQPALCHSGGRSGRSRSRPEHARGDAPGLAVSGRRALRPPSQCRRRLSA